MEHQHNIYTIMFTLSFLILIALIQIPHTFTIQVPPTWVTSPLVKAAQFNVINTLTGSSATPTATMTFTSAFSMVPNLAYGIINYEGNDRMSQECFQVNRTQVTTSFFSVRVQIVGITNIWVLTVRYIALDKAFPYQLNTFDNVPINYTKGNIVNISVIQPTQTYYTNIINYTAQALASGYTTSNTFLAPYSNYKILLFMNSMFLRSSLDTNSKPLNLAFMTTILSGSTYLLNVSARFQCEITRLQLSIIVYDEAGVQASNLYQLVSYRIDMSQTGGFIAVPQEFIPNLIMGIIEFSAQITATTMHFNLKFQNNAASPPVYGIFMPVSITKSGRPPFNRFGYTVFYMKTWICPNATFFNISSDLCQSCSIPNCQTCQTIDLCRTCMTGFFLSATAPPIRQCTSCPISNCLTCLNSTYCSDCDTALGYFQNSTSGLCQRCTITGCVSCSSLTVCTACDQPNSYFINPNSTALNDQCILCSIPQCLTCSSLTACTTCNEPSNFFLNPSPTNSSDQCIPCSIPYCVVCSNLNECLTCAPDYVLNTTTKTCSLCTVAHCLECLNGTLCVACDTGNNYFLVNGTVPPSCVLCTIPDCVICVDLTVCQTCDQENNYFLNPSPTNISNACILCTVPHCTLCASLTTCTTCNSATQYFLNPSPTNSSDQCISCSIPFCLTCSSLSACTVCNQSANYFLNIATTGAADACVLCSMAQCVQCASLTQCLVCDAANGFFVNVTDGVCYSCALANCLQCRTLTTCLICDTAAGYFVNPSTGLCAIPPPICGDNIFKSPDQACDDGNLEANDGCSPTCTVETDFVCEANPDLTMSNSVCYYVGQVNLIVVYIEKVDTKNQIEILLDLSPKELTIWNQVDFSSMVSLSNMVGFDSYEVAHNTDGTVSILINYSQDIHNTDITVELDPSKSGNLALSRSPVAQRNFGIVPSDNQVAFAFTDSTYEEAKITSILAYAVAGLSLFFFLLGIFARKLIGVEMIGVIQISYLSLLTLNSMNPCFKALSNIWFVNGLNYFSLLDKHHLRDTYTPLPVKGIFMYSRFTQNYNLTFLLLIVLPLTTSLILYILTRTLLAAEYRKRYYAKRMYKILVGETTFQGVMFSGYVVAVSLGLEFIYGIKNIAESIGIVSIVEGAFVFVVYVVYFVMIIKVPHYFGQFVNYFKQSPPIPIKNTENNQENQNKIPESQKTSLINRINAKWYNILMLQRLLIGSCLIFLLDIQLSPLLPICIFLVFALYTLFFRPYLKLMHNIRFSINMFVCMIVQGVYLGYKKMSFQERNGGAIWFLMPIIVCGLLLLTVIYNGAILIYQIVTQCKKQEENQKTLEKQEEVTFQLNRERNLTAKYLTDMPCSVTPGSPTNLSTRKQLEQIRKQIKKDFVSKENLLEKNAMSANGNTLRTPKSYAQYFELQKQILIQETQRQKHSQNEKIQYKIEEPLNYFEKNANKRSKNLQQSLKMNESNQESILLTQKYRQKLPEPERKLVLQVYDQI